MNTLENTANTMPNGSGAAAMLAAALGNFVLAVFAFAGDKSLAIRRKARLQVEARRGDQWPSPPGIVQP